MSLSLEYAFVFANNNELSRMNTTLAEKQEYTCIVRKCSNSGWWDNVREKVVSKQHVLS